MVGASIAGPCVRLHTPLIEPDGPISGIRLSEKGSRGRPREIARPLGKADEAQQFVQGGFRKPLGPRPQHFVLGTQPPTQPLASVTVHRSIGRADCPETEVVGPPNHRTVELRYHYLLVQQSLIPSSHFANRLADADHRVFGEMQTYPELIRPYLQSFL